jgi:hypothetical protein
MTARVLVVDDEPDIEPLDGRAGDEIILLLLDIDIPSMMSSSPSRWISPNCDGTSWQ